MPRTTRVTFKTATAHAVEYRDKAAPIVVEIEGETLTFRHEGHRKRYRVSIPDAMRLAILQTPPADT